MPGSERARNARAACDCATRRELQRRHPAAGEGVVKKRPRGPEGVSAAGQKARVLGGKSARPAISLRSHCDDGGQVRVRHAKKNPRRTGGGKSRD
jgi:hypothetical protein